MQNVETEEGTKTVWKTSGSFADEKSFSWGLKSLVSAARKREGILLTAAGVCAEVWRPERSQPSQGLTAASGVER